MDYVTPFVLAGAIVAGDQMSTTQALKRGGMESGPVQTVSRPVGATLQGALIAGGDFLVQKRMGKKAAWIYRGCMIVGGSVLVLHNNSVRR